jgi:hypothetical protein
VPRVVAIHQPNFLPWLGYFDKLVRADVFVLLDSVQFPRSGHGEWMNRVRLLLHGRPAWATAPIRRARKARIADVELDDDQPWRAKLLRTIELSYSRAPHFEETFALVEEILAHEERNLAAFNEHGVRRLGEALGIDTELARSSDLDAQGTGSDLLAELTVAVGGDVYLSGGGADAYQREESYEERGVTLRYQEFRHPTYPQATPEFVPGLSVVDALMSVGAAGVRQLQLQAAG